MKDLESWIDEMGRRPLPGGVAAAAVASAMGAALIGKALRITLKRERLAEADRAALTAVLEQAGAEQGMLMNLAEEDVRAYQAVIASRSLPAGDAARGRAWQAATDVPLGVAEACHRLLGELAGVLCQCWPSVCVDYQIGQELLMAGARAGRLAAEANLDEWGDAVEARPLAARLDGLLEAEGRFQER